jgi:hypothetical protein
MRHQNRKEQPHAQPAEPQALAQVVRLIGAKDLHWLDSVIGPMIIAA